MKCFQEAYAKSKSFVEFKEVKDFIIKLKTGNNNIENDPYLKKFYN